MAAVGLAQALVELLPYLAAVAGAIVATARDLNLEDTLRSFITAAQQAPAWRKWSEILKLIAFVSFILGNQAYRSRVADIPADDTRTRTFHASAITFANQAAKYENATRQAWTDPIRTGGFTSLGDLEAEYTRLETLRQMGAMTEEDLFQWVEQVYNPEYTRLARQFDPTVTESEIQDVVGEKLHSVPVRPELVRVLDIWPPDVVLPPRLRVGAGAGAVAVPGEVTVPQPTTQPGQFSEAMLAGGFSLGMLKFFESVGAGSATTGMLRFFRNLHMARNTCLATSATSMLGVVGQLFAPQVLPLTLLRTDIGKDIVDRFVAPLLREFVFPDQLPRPATPENVPTAAVDLVLQRFSFGAAAQAWASIVEMVTPLKTLGLNQFAGFLADLAGWQRLATALMAPVERAAIQRPMEQYANRLFRSTIPNLVDLEGMYAKHQIDYNRLADVLARWGYSNEWIKDYSQYLWRDPRLFEIVRIAQFYSPELTPELREPLPYAERWLKEREAMLNEVGVSFEDIRSDWWYWFKFMQAGYQMTDVRVLVEVAKRAIARREQTLFLDGTTRLFRDGFIDRPEMERLVREAWDLTNPIEARIRATELRAQYEDLADLRDIVLQSAVRGVITWADAERMLVEAGMRRTKVRLEIMKARLGVLPRMRLELPEELDVSEFAEEGAVAP